VHKGPVRPFTHQCLLQLLFSHGFLALVGVRQSAGVIKLRLHSAKQWGLVWACVHGRGGGGTASGVSTRLG
jgi:hypothetical protein